MCEIILPQLYRLIKPIYNIILFLFSSLKTLTTGSDIDPMFSHFEGNVRNVCGRRGRTAKTQKGNALYIDARTVDKGQKPWDETGDLISKVSPL